MILHLEQSVVERYKSSFKTIFVRVITAITILYVFFGVSGYLSYGEETRDVITFNLDQSDVGWIHWSVFVRVFLCSSLFLTYPLMMFPVTNILKRRISEICGCSPVSEKYCKINYFFFFIVIYLLGKLCDVFINEISIGFINGFNNPGGSEFWTSHGNYWSNHLHPFSIYSSSIVSLSDAYQDTFDQVGIDLGYWLNYHRFIYLCHLYL